MALVTAESLFSDAKVGKKLSTAERRHVLSWLDFYKRGEYTTVQLGEIFQVSERAIRLDRQAVRKKFASDIKKDIDVTLIIADIELTYRYIMDQLHRGLRATRAGTEPHRKYCDSLFRMQREVAQSYQDLGVLPKNVPIQKQSYNYIAIVNKDGSVVSREVESSKEIKESAIKFLEGRAGSPHYQTPDPPEEDELEGKDGYVFKAVVPSPIIDKP